MADKIWAHHPGGVVAEVTPPLPDDWVPGETIYGGWAAADVTNVTALSPQPAVGWTTPDSGKTFVAPAPVAVDLPALKTALKSRVDTDAEALRLTLITPGSGQAMEYQEAYAEAVQVDAAVKANAGATFDPAAYPMLAASLGYDLDPTTGKPTTDIAGEARAVLAAYDAYQRAGAAIRGVRLKAKAAIDAAADAASATAAFEAIIWPTLS